MQRRIIRLREVKRLTGLHESTIYRKEKAGLFPQRVRLGPNSIGFFEDEIADYNAQLARGFAHAPTKALEARGVER